VRVPWAILAAIGGGVLLISATGQQRWRGTTFGGRNDPWDLALGPARFPSPAKRETPEQYYSRIKEWQRAYFVPTMANYDFWPKDWANIYKLSTLPKYEKKLVKVGLSWFLNSENEDYFAWPVNAWTPEIRRAAEQGRAWLRVRNDQGVEVVGRIIDAGPAPAYASYTIDMSEHAHKTLSCDGKTKNLVFRDLIFSDFMP